ncbi:glycosyltransferase family 2 protein [Desulfonatronovibrio magnus]|uniref:glycosyltransferase family 2 protein n=1 Tax=Desulfonatronovibrio magnus TaxID=698827 RepID=UPI00069893D9|nr:glycosyltransferase [Desulfonatronovibrio magnus]
MEGIPPKSPFSVDVFVTTYNEPIKYLKKTLTAASRIEYSGQLTVYVLDDGGRQEVEALAKELGIKYLSRVKSGVPNENAKSGNLNFGLKNSSGDLILTLDADQVPSPHIVSRLVGYMDFEQVAFIQTKQEYYTQAGDPFYNKSQVFYDVVQLALDNNDNAFSAGTGVLYRRKALDDIGGFTEWNIVEDLTTSYELHSRGWKSFYFPHALSRGLAPDTIWGIYQQRGQWALDTMRLFIWDNPLFKKGLSFVTRLGYSTVAISYVCSAFVFPFFFLIPIWTYITGNSILVKPEWQFLLIRSIYLLLMVIATQYLAYKVQPGKQFRMLAGLFPVYMAGIIRAFKYPKEKKPGYCVNNAINACLSSLRSKPPIVAVLPQFIILVLNMVMPFVALFLGTCEPRIIAANVFVSAIAIWSMSQVVLSALSPGDFSEEENPEYVYNQDN